MSWACVTVMPVYNEAECVESVCLDWIRQMADAGGALLVVDDGSSDESPRILDRLAANEPRLIVVHQINGGHGAAVLNGYRQALALEPDWVFQVDSDGEMPAGLFQAIWARRFDAEFVLGRRTGRRAHLLRLSLSTAHRWLLGIVFRVSVRDPNIPFRLMKTARLRRLLEFVPPGVFAPNVFLSLLAAKAGVLADGPEVPVAPRAGGSPSIRGWRTLRLGARCAGELARFRMRGWLRFREVMP
ncbi:MAG: glycosyltransferase family 2 protein [Bryobacteraceae bacterium]|nr:glycosyltransferase family 2 protein [Bryobacteraceae bacterium]